MSAIGPGTNEVKHIAPEYEHAGKYHEIRSGSQSSVKTAQRLMLTMMTMIMMMLALMTGILRNIKSDRTSGTSCATIILSNKIPKVKHALTIL